MTKFIEKEMLMRYPIRINHYDEEHGNVNFVLGIECVLEYADYLPVMEIVRCKDCKHMMFSDFYGECSKGHMGIVSLDAFCSYGERKE